LGKSIGFEGSACGAITDRDEKRRTRIGEVLLKKLALLLSAVVCLSAVSASALELDWSGQFRSEFTYIKTYTLDGQAAANGVDPNRVDANGPKGYYIKEGGSNDAQFQTLFMKLQPKLIVNDNITIKSEWWVGDPVYGFYGNASPYTSDQKTYYSTFSRGSFITAQRFWGEFLTDFGTFKLGRIPLNYGMGLIWNSGDDMWSHYESTGDAVGLVSKFGAFSFIPTFVSYSTGNNIGGACQGPATTTTGTCTPLAGSGGLSDYSIQVKYENLDEDFEAGVNFIRRIAGAAQDNNPNAGYVWDGATTGLNYNTYDIYLKKKIGKLEMASEIPVVNGSVGGVPYSTWAFAADLDWRVNEPWEFDTKFGHAPGQPNGPTQQPGSYKGFYFNPDYKIALIMFNYQFRAFSGPNTLNNPNVQPSQLQSPYDNPITNANYLSFRPILHADKWKFHANYAFAKAPQAAQNGQQFWNTWSRQMQLNNSGVNQGSWLGWEMDYGADFQYDQYFVFGLELGWWFPGSYYGFSNTATSNSTNAVMAAAARVGVQF
jgi:hypothetical protein